jgi:hypothetical protein
VRRAFHLAAALSLLLLVAVVVLWARSYAWRDYVNWNRQPGPDLTWSTWTVETGKGGIHFAYRRSGRWAQGRWVPRPAQTGRRAFGIASVAGPYYPYALNDTIVRGAGFELSEHRHVPEPTSVGSGVVHEIHLVAPLWSAALACCILPAAAARRYRASRLRSRPGHCAACGYDLRATPDRCPECGSLPEPAPRAVG